MSETTASVGVPDYGWSSGEAEGSHRYLRPVVLSAIDHAAATAGRSHTRVFDAGCGNGALLLDLQSRGYEVAGCDASVSGVTHARIACGARARIEHLSVYDDLAGTFGSSWDVVVSTEVVEHLYAPRDFVRQVAHLLAPGGTLVLSTPYHGYLKNVALALSGALDAHFTALWDGGHIKFWSYRSLKALLEESGFTDFEFRGAGRLPWLWKSMVVVCRKHAANGAREQLA